MPSPNGSSPVNVVPQAQLGQLAAVGAGPAAGQGTTGPAVVSGTPAPVAGADPALVFRGFREKREILGRQLDDLESQRNEIVRQLRAGPASDADRTGLEQRLAQVDQRIAQVNVQIAEADQQVAQSAAVPGATIEPSRPNPWEHGPPEELVAMGIGFSALLLFPIVIAFARRIWRRSSVAVVVPPELTERMQAVERSIESVAIEVERIGEGQRFVTQLLASRAEAAQAQLPPADRAR